MVADDGTTPILMDFGSTIKARVEIKTRREAIAHQVCLVCLYHALIGWLIIWTLYRTWLLSDRRCRTERQSCLMCLPTAH